MLHLFRDCGCQHCFHLGFARCELVSALSREGKLILSDRWLQDTTEYGFVAGPLQGISIVLGNLVLQKAQWIDTCAGLICACVQLALILTKRENHEFENQVINLSCHVSAVTIWHAQFMDSLIVKCFALSAINSYLMLIIIAFVKSYADYFDVEDAIGSCDCTRWSRDGCTEDEPGVQSQGSVILDCRVDLMMRRLHLS